MLATNIEKEVKEILEKKGKGRWLRTDECAKTYGKGNDSRETKFYRWRKEVEKGKVRNFQVIKFSNNITFIGLKSADPKILESLISDKKITSSHKSGLGFFEFFDRRAERNRLEEERQRKFIEAKRRTYLELLVKKYPEEAKSVKDLLEIEKNSKRIGS